MADGSETPIEMDERTDLGMRERSTAHKGPVEKTECPTKYEAINWVHLKYEPRDKVPDIK